ncbi:proline iminopeptidase-family hydrolase [Olsenella sp. YH-ols2217]|uniref:Proline iminopeptidase n=1 Tax=Kribbibacterium absianum TaxID=3044210 RepID=A0ABT6ZN88_9ACTN|nr:MULTISPECIES: proline iminopeptidase-family hydrolase [unclassified Olsenella]MDJ1122317.1 proline iminopeptidase-family hydrolase [Olsenella sp. YH-ols2216]MDJ1130269.1 proline iminopeptidase-family hydrolase [Olsenella sp. YH-ols2217]
MQETTGRMPFDGDQTWYRIVGDLGEKIPLLTIHGGPGNTHYYLRPLDLLAERYGRPVVYYDQIGCGNSRAASDPERWTLDFFERELVALRAWLAERHGIERVFLLGQSWGGMLLMHYAAQRPEGVAGVILASTLADTDLWVDEAQRLRSYLPQAMRDALVRADETDNYETPEARAAIAEYYRRHVAAVPEGSRGAWDNPFRDDPVAAEVYETMQGKSEFLMTGNLKHWSIVDQLGRIEAPVLITSGIADEATPVQQKLIYDHIPGARWELLPGTHGTHMEFPERYCAVVEEFMERVE